MNSILAILIPMLFFLVQTDENKNVLGRWVAVSAINELDQPCTENKQSITFLKNNKFEMSLHSEIVMTGDYSLDKKTIHLTKINDNQYYSRKNYAIDIPILKFSIDTLILKYTACPASDVRSEKTGKIVLIKSN